MPDINVQQAQAAVQLPDNNPEGQMAKADLYRAAKMSIKLFQMIQDGQDLEEWVQAKITKSADYLDSIYHYMEYQMKFGSGNAAVASVDDITAELDTIAPEERSEEDDEEELENMEESMNYTQKLQALLEGAMKKAKPDFLDMDKDGNKKEPMKKAVKDKKATEGFDADAKVGDKFKTAKGTATKTATGVRHTRDKYDYDPGSDDVADKKMKRDAKKKTTKEGFDADAKVGDKFKTAKGTATKTATGVKHTRDKYDYDPGSDDVADKKMKRDAKKKKNESLVAQVTKRVVEAKKKAKPDFLDMDKDGDKKEPMKKAVADKKEVKESVVTESADLARMKQLMKRLNG